MAECTWSFEVLHRNSDLSDPMGEAFDYAKEFKSLDLKAVIKDLRALMTDSQEWWPADFGHYGGLMIRMAWHSAGTYRITDGRGGAGAGQQRFAPLNSWPDNANLDKARRLLCRSSRNTAVKISWADLWSSPATSRSSDGLQDVRLCRRPRRRVGARRALLGSEGTWLGDERYSGERQLAEPLGAVQMGLIYVNPEGPNGNPDPVAAAKDIRETFFRMAMNDEETVALIAGGHSFGKTHGAGDPSLIGPEPEGGAIEDQGLGWKSKYGTGIGADAITGGPEVTWTQKPTKWSNNFFKNLFDNEWELTKSPAGRKAVEGEGCGSHDPGRLRRVEEACADHADHDLSLQFDPAYEKISRRFYENPDQFADAFARAWFKLTHRDMGPRARYLGPLVPKETLIWQDPIPTVNHPLIGETGHRGAEGQDPRVRPVGVAACVDRLGVGLDVPRLRQAWRRQRRTHSSQPRRRTGRSTSRRSSRRCLQKLEAIQKEFAQEGFACRPDRSRRLCRGRKSREGRRCRREGALHAGPHGRRRRSRPTSNPSRRSSRAPTASATTSAASSSSWCRKKRWWTGRNCCG